ncbi:MAG: DeoR/GlpR family DNA-binding transcription regulator [Candidatus Kryptoniota bacterium]
MKRLERIEAIRHILEQRGMVSIDALASLFEKSTSSIRRDIALCQRLPQFGDIQRVPGGLALDRHEREPEFNKKMSLNRDLKFAIAKIAAREVNDGDSILIDSGTTCFLFSTLLHRHRNLRIITTDITIAKELASNTAFETTIVGGIVRPGYYSVGGSSAEYELAKLNPTKVFMSVDALDLEYGITNAAEFEVGIKRKLLSYGTSVYLLVDATKIGQRALYWVAPLTTIKLLITNDILDPAMYDRLVHAGVNVELAPSKAK